MNLIADIEYAIAQPELINEQTESLVCLHGIGGDHNSFAPQLSGLSHQYRVISWCMPGYRASKPLPSVTFSTLRSSLLKFMDELELSTAHIIGQSIGGMLAQELAHTARDRVASLTLIATTSAFGGRDSTFKQQFLADRLAPLQQGESMESLANRFITGITGPGACKDAVDFATDSMAAVPASTYVSILECLVTFDRYSDIPKLHCPVSLIAGSEDTNAPAITMEKMATRCPNAEFHCIPGAGHLVNLEKPVETNAIISNFLSTQIGK